MGIITFNKLVRDKIPEILQKSEKTFSIKLLEDQNYNEELNKILDEYVKEYIEGGSIEKLVDIVEVIKAILAHKNINIEDFEAMRQNIYKEKGGFKLKIFLEHIDKK